MATDKKHPLSGVYAGIDHVTYPVLDLDTAEKFYTEVLGGELLERFDAETFLRYRPERAEELANPRNSPLHLSLQFGRGARVDLFLQNFGQPAHEQAHPHLAFGVSPADLDRAVAHLRSVGVPVDGPRRLGPPGQASAYFFDPFGNKLEFVTDAYPHAIPFGAPNWDALRYAWRG